MNENMNHITMYLSFISNDQQSALQREGQDFNNPFLALHKLRTNGLRTFKGRENNCRFRSVWSTCYNGKGGRKELYEYCNGIIIYFIQFSLNKSSIRGSVNGLN